MKARNRARREKRRLGRNLRRAGFEGLVKLRHWLRICQRFDQRCAFCSTPVSRPTLDHLRPVSRGGRHVPENVVPACPACNHAKGDRLLWVEWIPPRPHPLIVALSASVP